jgi:hypothetical protein
MLCSSSACYCSNTPSGTSAYMGGKALQLETQDTVVLVGDTDVCPARLQLALNTPAPHATAEEVCADDLMCASDLRCSGATSVRHDVLSQPQLPADSHHAHSLLNRIRTPPENRSLVAFGRLGIFGGHPRGSIPLHAPNCASAFVRS